MKKVILPLLFVLSCAFLFSCHERKCCDPEPSTLGTLFISIKHNGQPYPDSLMAGVQLYYYYNGQKITNPNNAPSRPLNMMYLDTVLLQRTKAYDSTHSFFAPGCFSSLYVLDAVVLANIHDFYLQFPDNIIDTLNIDVKSVKEKDVTSVACQCLHQITHITSNGQPLPVDTTRYSIYSQPDNANYLIQK